MAARSYRGALTDRDSMKKTPIGHVNCPICGHTDAEVKTDKNGRAYIHCKHACSWQGITRTNHQSDQLKNNMRPVTVTGTEPIPLEQPEPQPAAATIAAPVAAQATQTKTPPAPVKKAASWFQPILSGGQS